MIVSREDISRYSTRILDFFDERKINSMGRFEDSLGTNVKYPDGTAIEISWRPSRFNLYAMTLSLYDEVNKPGIPVEIRALNFAPAWRWSIFTKCNEKLEGYVPFAIDACGNMMQFHETRDVDWRLLKGAIENLAGGRDGK